METKLFERLVLAHQNYPRCKAPLWALSGHLQTVMGYLNRHPQIEHYDSLEKIPTTDGEHLWAGIVKGQRPVVLTVIHGLGGDVNSFFVQRSIRVAKKLGFHCLAVNQRGAGEGVHFSKQLYHSGRWNDLQSVSQYVREKFPNCLSVFVTISMSGNMTLKWLGSYPDVQAPDLSIVFNAPLKLEKASRSLQHGLNRIYDQHFVQGFRELLKTRREKKLLPANFAQPKFNSVFEFDQQCTAPMNGFSSVQEYYSKCSSFDDLQKIKSPTLVVTAKDDPFVDYKDYESANWSSECHLRIEKNGGHGGYLQKKKNSFKDHFWMDDYLLEILSELS